MFQFLNQFLNRSSPRSSGTLPTAGSPFIPPPSASSEPEVMWKYIEAGLDIIMSQENMSYQSYLSLYTTCTSYSCSTRRFKIEGDDDGEKACTHLYRTVMKYFTSYLMSMREDSEILSNEELLRYYADRWTHFTTRLALVNKLFGVLNRRVKMERDEGRTNVYPVYSLVLVLWRQIFFKHVQTKNTKIANIVINQIEKQRLGEAIDQSLLKLVVDSFVSLGLDEGDTNKVLLDVYRERFEDSFIRATERFYKNESDAFLSENSLTDYLRLAETRLKEEEDRIEQYLNSCTRVPLISRCENVLIRRYSEAMCEEFETLLDLDKVEDLRRMIALLARIPDGLVRPCKIFEERVKKAGLTAVADVVGVPGERIPSDTAMESPEPQAYVDSLLEVYSENSEVVARGLRGETCFVACLDRACREFVNNNCATGTSMSRSPELFAKCANALLRKRNKVADVEQSMNKILGLYKYIYDKDVFQIFYMTRFSDRLIHDSSASEESEVNMILKLKIICGFEYSNKLQRMLTDVALSRDLTDEFQAVNEEVHPKERKFSFGVKVLGKNFWPLKASGDGFHVPRDILRMHERFESFYHAKHPGRNLTWLWKHSTSELRTSYLSREYILKTSSYQTAVLLHYNDHDVLEFSELHAGIGIDEESLADVLASLVDAKVLIMTETTKRYKLNLNFKSKHFRINLNHPKETEIKAESLDIQMAVDEDRKYILQATVVRIMKARKTMEHQPLIQEVISQVSHRFKPNVSGIKKAIDMLLEKEFLARVDGTRDTFVYIP